jgi:toxin ParE1/3/4
MGIRIEWSELSERQLKDLFVFYSFEASPRIAVKLINRIVNRVSILASNPSIGSKEELLSEYTEDFRYLVESNYKIIYWQKENVITIASVFDCRLNPEKIKKI